MSELKRINNDPLFAYTDDGELIDFFTKFSKTIKKIGIDNYIKQFLSHLTQIERRLVRTGREHASHDRGLEYDETISKLETIIELKEEIKKINDVKLLKEKLLEYSKRLGPILIDRDQATEPKWLQPGHLGGGNAAKRNVAPQKGGRPGQRTKHLHRLSIPTV